MRINELIEVLNDEQKVIVKNNSSILFKGTIEEMKNNNLIKTILIKNIRNGKVEQTIEWIIITV